MIPTVSLFKKKKIVFKPHFHPNHISPVKDPFPLDSVHLNPELSVPWLSISVYNDTVRVGGVSLEDAVVLFDKYYSKYTLRGNNETGRVLFGAASRLPHIVNYVA